MSEDTPLTPEAYAAFRRRLGFPDDRPFSELTPEEMNDVRRGWARTLPDSHPVRLAWMKYMTAVVFDGPEQSTTYGALWNVFVEMFRAIQSGDLNNDYGEEIRKLERKIDDVESMLPDTGDIENRLDEAEGQLETINTGISVDELHERLGEVEGRLDELEGEGEK